MKAVVRMAALSAAGLLAASAGYALGQQSAPTDYMLVAENVLAAIDLAKEIDSVANRELRLSRAIVAPGGHIGPHSHQGDAPIVYLLSGVLTNHHDDVFIADEMSGFGSRRSVRFLEVFQTGGSGCDPRYGWRGIWKRWSGIEEGD